MTEIIRVPLNDLKFQEKSFSEKHEIKPWVENQLYKSKGIEIVIERSDRKKIIFRCKNTLEKHISKGNTRRHVTCPFKLRANYSCSGKKWTLVIVDDHHNHDPRPPDKHDKLIEPKTPPDKRVKYDIEDKLEFEISDGITSRISQIIKNQITLNSMISEDSKANILKTVINTIIQEHKDTINFHNELRNIGSWYSSPNLTVHPSANLIPLSPLLNDSDGDYPDTNPSPNGNQTALDSLTLPGINSNFLMNNPTTSNNFVIPNQLQILQIQNHNKQLPPFNSIQNNLPLSPTVTNSLLPNPTFSSNHSSIQPNSSLMTSNTTSTNTSSLYNLTLNPSYILKSYSKQSNPNFGSLAETKPPQVNNYLGTLSSLLNVPATSPPGTGGMKTSPFANDSLPFKQAESDSE